MGRPKNKRAYRKTGKYSKKAAVATAKPVSMSLPKNQAAAVMQEAKRELQEVKPIFEQENGKDPRGRKNKGVPLMVERRLKTFWDAKSEYIEGQNEIAVRRMLPIKSMLPSCGEAVKLRGVIFRVTKYSSALMDGIQQ